MKVVYFGAWDDRVSPRVRLLRDGLRAVGVEVVECRARGPVLRRYARLLRELPRAAHSADLLLVGKPGQREMPLAAAAARALQVPLALDCFASLYVNEVLERRRVAPHSFTAWKLRALDRFALRHAGCCLVDTHAHGRLIARTLGVAGATMRRVFVGAEELFRPLPGPRQSGPIEALFVGTFIPFHGIEVILRAAHLLRDEPRLVISLLGDGQMRPQMEALAAALRLTNVRFEPPLPYDALPVRIARTDLCLGLFAGTPTARAVIPKKVFAALACGKPVVTADTEGIREALDPASAALVPCDDPTALATTLRALLDDPERRRTLGQRARALHEQHFHRAALGRTCALALTELLAKAQRGVPLEQVP